jgi:predicted transcriptional regulator
MRSSARAKLLGVPSAVLDDDDELTAEERAEIDAGLDEAARGEGSPAEEVLRRLRSLG